MWSGLLGNCVRPLCFGRSVVCEAYDAAVPQGGQIFLNDVKSGIPDHGSHFLWIVDREALVNLCHDLRLIGIMYDRVPCRLQNPSNTFHIGCDDLLIEMHEAAKAKHEIDRTSLYPWKVSAVVLNELHVT